MESFTGTRPVAASHAFDAAALERFLAARLDGFAGPLAIDQFRGGQSNPTYRLMTPGRTYVMRTKPGPAAKLLPSAHAIEREFRVMAALAASAVPVPRMLLSCDDEAVIGRAFYLMEFVAGRVLWDQTLPGMTPPERAAIYDETNRVIAALHAVDPAALGLADYGRPGNYFERQIARWTRQYAASATRPIASMDALIEWLPAHVPAGARDGSRPAVVHGDFRLDNLVFEPTEPRVVAVLDWELSTLGDPLADFSYHCMSWHVPVASGRGIAGADLAALGIPSEDDYLRRYCERTGRGDPGALAAVRRDWNFHLAYNLFRIAAILQGVAKRADDGIASSAEAKQSGAGAAALAEIGWRFARQAG